MDLTKELVSLIVGIVFLAAMSSFFYSSYTFPTTGVSRNAYSASDDLAKLVAACCRKHAGSYRTYNDDCNMIDIDIDGTITEGMITDHVPDSCRFEMKNDLTGKNKIKITYMGKERKVVIKRVG